MGVSDWVSYDKFPAQGKHKRKLVSVCFDYDLTKTLIGTVMRHDTGPPYVTIIMLEDGRFVLATECQYRLLD